MNRFAALTLVASATLFSACGSDYDANPVVIRDEDDDFIIISNENTTPVPTETTDLFSQQQRQALQQNLWQSSCLNGQILELAFDSLDRTTRLFTYNDTNCSVLANPPTISVDSYTVTQRVTTSTGQNVSRIEFRQTIGTNVQLDRTLFVVNSNSILYFGQGSTNPLVYDTSINFNIPYFAIDESNRIRFEPTEVTFEPLPAAL